MIDTNAQTRDKFGARPKNPDGALAEHQVHDSGRVALLATYGSDDLIAEAARVSYGKGTTKQRDTRALLRYLMRHRHTSPFEQAEVTFFLRVPIFIMRQLVRHRTANINEYSARFSELAADFYLPAKDYLHEQSAANKQGRGTAITDDTEQIQMEFVTAQQGAFDTYERLLTKHNISRELARVVTPVGTYTELYWKCDLHNFFHFLKLRLDPHAQREIRDYAQAMYTCVKPFFPHAAEAWEDYALNTYTLSALERKMLSDLLKAHVLPSNSLPANNYHMSAREYADFKLFIEKALA